MKHLLLSLCLFWNLENETNYYQEEKFSQNIHFIIYTQTHKPYSKHLCQGSQAQLQCDHSIQRQCLIPHSILAHSLITRLKHVVMKTQRMEPAWLPTNILSYPWNQRHVGRPHKVQHWLLQSWNTQHSIYNLNKIYQQYGSKIHTGKPKFMVLTGRYPVRTTFWEGFWLQFHIKCVLRKLRSKVNFYNVTDIPLFKNCSNRR